MTAPQDAAPAAPDRPAGSAPDPAVDATPAAESARRAWGMYALGMAAVGLLAVVAGQDAYWATLLTGALLFAGLASAWNIIGGFGGQFSFGHAAFFGVGAYSVALPQVRLGWSPWPGLLLGAVLAAVLAAAIAWPIFRLRGPFFAIATLAISAVVLSLGNYLAFTGGSRGVTIPFQDALFVEPAAYLLMMFLYCAGVVAVALAVLRSPLGYRLRAVRDDDEAARAVGINPLAVKTTGLVLSAALTAVGGGLFTTYVGFIDPASVFNLAEISVRLPLLALLGGIGTVSGPVIGALIVQPGADYLRGEFGAVAPGLHMVILGALLIVFALYFKRGVRGAVDALWRRRGRRR
jgi:branched-chain amino acid transport system permease protein